MVREKIKIIHAGLNSTSIRETQSIEQLQSLGLRYIRIENEPYNIGAPQDSIFKGWKDFYKGSNKPLNTLGLTDRHYGAWLSHKQSIMLGFCDKGHSLICEGDCKILNIELFKERLEEAIEVLNTNPQYHIVRFESPNNGIQTQFTTQVSTNIYECDKIMLGHCYLVNEKSKDFFTKLYEEEGWTTPDDWLLFTFNDRKIPFLGFKEPLTSQFDGFSEIDKINKTYKS